MTRVRLWVSKFNSQTGRCADNVARIAAAPFKATSEKEQQGHSHETVGEPGITVGPCSTVAKERKRPARTKFAR
jgi:hypothetical protein